MLLQEKRVTIDGHEYNIKQLGALQGRKVWLKLLHVLVAPLRELSTSSDLNEKAIAGALAAAIDTLDEKTAEELYEIFGQHCELHSGEKWPKLDGPVFDIHFAGRYLSMTKWLWECISFNFAGFLGDTSLGKMTDLLRTEVSKRVSPRVSTGLPGES